MSEIDNPNILIIGGGPVGLWTAIQLKRERPDFHVIVHERYTSYRRNHVLRLKKSSLRSPPHKDNSPGEDLLFKALLNNSSSTLLSNQITIRTKELEELLKQHAIGLGAEIRYTEIPSANVLKSMYPSCGAFIAADGAHSLIRKEIFSNQLDINKDLQFVIELKYDVSGPTKALNIFTDHYRSVKLLKYPVLEYVGRNANGTTPITLRFFVPEHVYVEVGEASFKDPITVENYQKRLTKSLSDEVNTYLTIRKSILGDRPVFDSMKLSKLKLSVYGAKNFGKTEKNAKWFLVGDAAMGMPYFRSLNAGLLCGSVLAKLLSNRTDVIAAYNHFARKRLKNEYCMALIKNMLLTLYIKYIRASAVVPWQVNKWSGNKVRHYMQNLYNEE